MFTDKHTSRAPLQLFPVLKEFLQVTPGLPPRVCPLDLPWNTFVLFKLQIPTSLSAKFDKTKIVFFCDKLLITPMTVLTVIRTYYIESNAMNQQIYKCIRIIAMLRSPESKRVVLGLISVYLSLWRLLYTQPKRI